ncbi:MAG: ABC transporter ATP-binding protein [Lautropia sp.]
MSARGLRFEHLAAGYGDTMVIRDVSGEAGAGRVLAILGRNGVGKSTLMKALAGFVPVSSGSVGWNGEDLSRVPAHARLAAGIAYAPQENVVFGELSVADNLWLHLHDRDPIRYEAALAAFPRLRERMRQRAGSLSGGERKLLSFTRTLGLRATLSLLDEPTEGVQPENIDRMVQLIVSARSRGLGFVIVEQNLGFVERIADEILVLDHGECVLSGPLHQWGREQLEKHLIV